MSKESELTEYYEIRSPHYFQLLVEDLWENHIKVGTLTEVKGTLSIEKLVDRLRKNEALPDIVNITFSTVPAGKEYLLSCDTYHGGGVFKKL